MLSFTARRASSFALTRQRVLESRRRNAPALPVWLIWRSLFLGLYRVCADFIYGLISWTRRRVQIFLRNVIYIICALLINFLSGAFFTFYNCYSAFWSVMFYAHIHICTHTHKIKIISLSQLNKWNWVKVQSIVHRIKIITYTNFRNFSQKSLFFQVILIKDQILPSFVRNVKEWNYLACRNWMQLIEIVDLTNVASWTLFRNSKEQSFGLFRSF